MWYLILVVALLIAGCVVGIPFLLQWLASENLFFTTVREGTAKAIMRGDSFDRFIMSFEGYHLNDPKKWWYSPKLDENEKVVWDKDAWDDADGTKLPDWEVVYHSRGNRKGFDENRDERYDERTYMRFGFLLKRLGIYWVGFPWAMKVYVYDFEWNETSTDKDTGEQKIFPRVEPTDFIFVSDFIYAIQTMGAETGERLPTDELTQITIAVRNPYRALFSGENWMERITAAINRHVRTFVGNHDYQELIAPGKGNGTDENGDVAKDCIVVEDYWRKEFSEPIISLNGRLPDDKKTSSGNLIPPFGIKGRYGVEIRTADLQKMDLSGAGEMLNQAAATKAYAARQEAKRILVEGKAKAAVIEITGEKEAEALKARLVVIKENGATGELLAQLDAMQEASKGAGNTVIWANNPFVPFADVLKKSETKGGQS